METLYQNLHGLCHEIDWVPLYLKGQSHEVDQALFDKMHSSRPGLGPELVFEFSEAPLIYCIQKVQNS